VVATTRKTLRHYHDLGLLEPAEVAPVTGYRYYDTTQARLIRRFRDLDMPVPTPEASVSATDEAARCSERAALRQLRSAGIRTRPVHIREEPGERVAPGRLPSARVRTGTDDRDPRRPVRRGTPRRT
jgi:DNA-binding transcriptional MerR regulator